MRLTIMHNPTAGGGKLSGDELLKMVRDAGHQPTYQSTKDENYPLALKEPGELVVVAGGDGTVRKIATRLAGRNILIAVLPLGTANNISKTLGITGSLQELIAGWAAARRRKFDVGVARAHWEERKFIEGMGLGLFTKVMATLDAQKKKDPATFQRTDNPLALALRALHDALADYRSHGLEVTLDGEDYSGQYLLLEAMNIRHVGPNLYLAPDADPSDGYLDFVFLTSEKRKEFSDYLAYRLEGKQEAPYLLVRRGRHLQIVSDGSEIRLDDKIWIKKGKNRQKGRFAKDKSTAHSPSAVIDIRVQKHALEFLIPAEEGASV